MLRTNLATRRTFVRLRANPDKPEALSGLGLSVLHLFFLSPKRGCKKTCRFFTAPYGYDPIDIFTKNIAPVRHWLACASDKFSQKFNFPNRLHSVKLLLSRMKPFASKGVNSILKFLPLMVMLVLSFSSDVLKIRRRQSFSFAFL